MVTIDLLILTCLTPEVTNINFQTFFCKMLNRRIEYKNRTIQYIVDEVLYVAKCNLGRVKIRPMLGSSFTKFGRGGGGPKVLIHLYMYVLYALLRLAWCLHISVFPSLPSQVS